MNRDGDRERARKNEIERVAVLYSRWTGRVVHRALEKAGLLDMDDQAATVGVLGGLMRFTVACMVGQGYPPDDAEAVLRSVYAELLPGETTEPGEADEATSRESARQADARSGRPPPQSPEKCPPPPRR